MRRKLTALLTPIAILALSCLSSVGLADAPRLVRTSEQWQGHTVSYLVQSSTNGELRLDANNGFFDHGFVAKGQKAVSKDDQGLISAHFEHLALGRGHDNVTARWHILVASPGELTIRPEFNVPAAERQVRWRLSMGNIKREFVPGSAEAPVLTFPIRKGGRHTISLQRLDNETAGETRIVGLVVSGPAAKDAGIIRARWRPAAIHTQYSSSTCPQTKMWVFETQAIAPVSSYSPITTRFGYYGATFDSNGRAAGGVNFSMWAASRNAKQAPPLNQMPHLLATGNPDAEFGGFGHEGSGVKIRNWEPLAHHPASVIQALRVDTENGYDTWSGYLFDERIGHWVLYAVGRRPTQLRRGETETYLRPASFCEIPGPPATQRSGDVRRVMRRRGWFYGENRQWHPVDRQTTGVRRGDNAPTNKFIAAEDGWFLMGTGGVEMLDPVAEVRQPAASSKLPDYLQPKIASELFELSVKIGESSANANRTTARVRYTLNDAGPGATAVLHYGPVDCLTFVSRELHGTEKAGVSATLLSGDRVWTHATTAQPVKGPQVDFQLTDLKPGTHYFYRLLVTNQRGKSWAFESGSFETR